MPQRVPERRLVRINALDLMITGASSLAGPAFGVFPSATSVLGRAAG
ncbi:hypothetical protein [Enterorhabdus sp. P55]|nr:hypothetical protein [Enterorhabdus sp. P55]